MRLSLPCPSFTVEGRTVKVDPWHINGGKTLPLGNSHGRRIFGVLIDYVLEMIHHSAVGNEGQSIGKMLAAEFSAVFAEEILCTCPAEEFHCHGMYLTAFKGRLAVIGGEHITGSICRKSMTCFVGYDLHISLCTVEVCKNKWGAEIGKLGAVAACRLALSAQHVHKLVFHHKIKELCCLRRKLSVKASACFENILGRSLRHCVSVTVEHGGIRIFHGICHTYTLSLLSAKSVGNRNDVFHHCFTEFRHIFGCIAVSAHIEIAELYVVFISELFRHCLTHLHHIVIYAVKLLLMLLVERTFSRPCTVTHLVIGGLLIGRKL